MHIGQKCFQANIVHSELGLSNLSSLTQLQSYCDRLHALLKVKNILDNNTTLHWWSFWHVMWYISNPLLFLILVSSSLLSGAIISTILLSTTLPINYTRLVCPWGSPSKCLRRSQIGLISNGVGPGFLETEVWALVKVGDRCSYCFLGKTEGL